jgi:Ca-activated chloride channel family protein
LSFLAPLGAIALLAIPAIVLLYFLKIRRPEVLVSTLMFWRPQRIDRQANAPWQKLRLSPLLVVQVLAALALGLALLRPGVIGAAGVASTTVVIVDGSVTMQATDVQPSRFQAAVQRTRDMAGQLASGQQMAVVLAGSHAELLSAPTGDAAAVRSALDRARPSGIAGDFAQAVSLADSLLAGRPGGSIVFLSDGHSQTPPAPPRLAAPLTYVSIGSSGENAGIETITRTASGSVFLRLANYGHRARDLRVEMRADGRLADVLPVHLGANGSTDVTWNGLPRGAQALEARLSPSDAFRLDDAAWLVAAPPPARRILLVTTENGFLQRALQLRPGAAVTVQKPGQYRGGQYDLYVFDGFVPAGPLPEPALVLNPPRGQGPVPAGQPVDPGAVLPGDPRDPLLQSVVLKDVHVQAASQVSPGSDWRTVIAAANVPLVMARDGDARTVELSFDLHHSDLPLRAAFPVLVDNLLSYLLPGGFENQAFALGRPVTLTAGQLTTRIEVTGPDGGVTTLTPPFPAFTPDQPGLYQVREQAHGGGRSGRFVVLFEDPSLARIAPGPAPVTQQAPTPRGALPRGTLELWPWLAAAALALLALEWLLYLRGGSLLGALRRRASSRRGAAAR